MRLALTTRQREGWIWGASVTKTPSDPLDVSDEELVARYQAGEAAVVEVLLTRYRHLAHIKARSYFLAGAGKDDVVQEGMIGLYKAIRDYRSGRRAAFRTFADVCITRQIVSAIKTATRHKHDPLNSGVSLSKPLPQDEHPDRVLADILPAAEASDPADVVIKNEEIQGVRRAFAEVLSGFETEVLHLYIEGKSYQEIASSLGRSVKAIDNALQRIKRKLEMSLGVAEPAEASALPTS